MDFYFFDDKLILVDSATGSIPDPGTATALLETGLLAEQFEDVPYAYRAAWFSTKDGQHSIPDGCRYISLRDYFASHSPEESARAARAKGLLSWRTAMKFCPACGSTLSDDPVLMARVCTSCGRQYFPRIEPCIIVLVSRGKEILLARHRMHNQNIWSCIAGFIEIGETAEQAVAREVREETGLEIKNLRYCASQGWPFPDQLMLAYRAEYAGGTIQVQEEELFAAQWFSRSALPAFPNPGSMGYRLISGEFN